MKADQSIMDAYGQIGVDMLRQSVHKVDATHKTSDSITYKVTENRLQLIGRAFFSTLETGRGPRKNATKGDFQDNMLEYMQARGIGAELDPKKKAQLARFLTWKINKEGDLTWKKGGRTVYSPALTKFTESLIKALTIDLGKQFKADILSIAHGH